LLVGLLLLDEPLQSHHLERVVLDRDVRAVAVVIAGCPPRSGAVAAVG